MKIGIIGCGYVGQASGLRWKLGGHLLAVTTRRPERAESLRIVADQIYLLNSQNLGPFIAQQEALLISIAPDATSTYASTYLKTAQQMAEQVTQAPALQQILYTSSTSVYGDQGGAWVDENCHIIPSHDNAKILYDTEQILLGCSSEKLKICILRLGEIYGPGREIEQRLRRMQHQPFAGTGEAYTNLIHLSDIVSALDFALRNRLNGIYNLCNDFHMPRKLFYQKLCEQEKIPFIQWDPTKPSMHGGNRRVSNQKIKNTGFIFECPG